MMEGLREEYQTAISFLRVAEFDSLESLQSKLIQVCNSMDKRQKTIATSDSTSAHFGSVGDAFGYQQPPSASQLRSPLPTETDILHNVINGFRAHLSINSSIADDTLQAVEHALMAATAENRICYFCNQPGHIAANCPKKRQQRQQQNTSIRSPGQYPPQFPSRPPGYQMRQPQMQQRGYSNSGRNVVPNRPQFQPPSGITPVSSSQAVNQTTPISRGATQHQPPHYQPQYPNQSPAGYYSVPSFSAYQHMPPQPYPAGYYSGYPVPNHHPTNYHPPSHQIPPQYNIQYNPMFQNPIPPGLHPPGYHATSAYISSETPGIGDNYAPDPGLHQPDFDEFDLEFGEDQFDDSTNHYCGMNATPQVVIDTIPRYPTSHNALSQHYSMAELHKIPTSPLPTIVKHWVELCSGGMLAGLSAALSNGVTIKRVTLVEKNRVVRFIAGRMLTKLQSKYPAQLSPARCYQHNIPPATRCHNSDSCLAPFMECQLWTSYLQHHPVSHSQ
jgi:hypothetical protein